MSSAERRKPCRIPDEKRCEALLRDSYLRPTNDRCRAHASVKLRGRHLCGKHGSAFALQVALKTGAAIELPFSPPPRCAPRFANQDEL